MIAKPRRAMVRGRPRLILGWVVSTIVALFGFALPAAAAADDQIDDLAVMYTVQPDGSLLVHERITLRFGVGSARHGLERWLVTRKPYDDEHDLTYEISDPVVTSSTQASTPMAVQRDVGEGRVRLMRIRVGDANRRIFEPTATYELSYQVWGALRTVDGHAELDWDVTGTQLPRVLVASARVQVAGGVDQTFCSAGSAGPAGSVEPCTAGSVRDGAGTYRASNLAAGTPFTIAAAFSSRLVSGAQPMVVENADLTAQRVRLVILVASIAGALVVPLLGWWYYRRNGQDRRYADLPPGILAGPDENPTEVRDPGVQIPLAQSPPAIPLVHAALLLDGGAPVRSTTASLFGLAVDGAIRLRVGHASEARLVDARRASDRPSAILLDELFEGGETVAHLSAGVLAEGHDRINAAAAESAAEDEWFVRSPRRNSAGTAVIAALGLAYIGYLLVGTTALYLLPLLLSVLITVVVLIGKLARGQRTGRGRALTDQIEGFRNYLASVTADQLDVQHGEDVFSRHLPWAILFGLTDRWTKVCLQLVEENRLSAAAPSWYDGTSWNLAGLAKEIAALNSSVAAATRVPDLAGGPHFGPR